MRPKEIVRLQLKRPYIPLRVHVSDGSWYDVRHPEMMTVTSTLVFIGQEPFDYGLPERFASCDPLHVTRVEPIDGATPKRPRGKRR